MDRAKFTQQSPGRIVQIEKPQKDWAFIPEEFPPRWEFDIRLWPLVVDAKEALGTLNGVGQALPNPELLLRPLRTREAIASSKIEGTYVTPEQLLLYELDPREPRQGDEQMADWLEVVNYGNAVRRGCELLKTLPLCNRLIKEMHLVLMQGVRGRNKSPGDFRKGHVQIGDSGRFIPPPGSEVERLTANFERYLNASMSRYDPLVGAFLAHYQFEAIHPFLDGNGRVGRALLSLTIYKWLGHTMPWLYMSAFFERYRDEYVNGLFNVSARGEWYEWIEFCLRGTVIQAKDSSRRCLAFKRLREELNGRIKSASPRTYLLIDGLFSEPVVRVTTIKNKFGVTYHTAKDDIQRLVDVGILAELSQTRPRSFFAPEIVKIAFDEPDWGEAEPRAVPEVATVAGQPSEQSLLAVSSTV